ncbi:10941_t:CDS:2 [Diversispora eburnea]|uniref:10941_t:CDS:1 n=1 Tax=Diversispora eburnea TaxID=1213867 RepID=A0A9N8VN51_9GLOM|nr:10941_t:CDS:2 [Diversispora eburnea]
MKKTKSRWHLKIYIHNSNDLTDAFLKEVISHGITNSNDFIIQCYGIIKDPNSDNNMMVIEFAEDGSLYRELNVKL